MMRQKMTDLERAYRQSQVQADREELRRLYHLREQALKLLNRLDQMSTPDFSLGRGKELREALREALKACGAIEE